MSTCRRRRLSAERCGNVKNAYAYAVGSELALHGCSKRLPGHRSRGEMKCYLATILRRGGQSGLSQWRGQCPPFCLLMGEEEVRAPSSGRTRLTTARVALKMTSISSSGPCGNRHWTGGGGQNSCRGLASSSCCWPAIPGRAGLLMPCLWKFVSLTAWMVAA